MRRGGRARFKAHAWNACKLERVSGVRIPAGLYLRRPWTLKASSLNFAARKTEFKARSPPSREPPPLLLRGAEDHRAKRRKKSRSPQPRNARS